MVRLFQIAWHSDLAHALAHVIHNQLNERIKTGYGPDVHVYETGWLGVPIRMVEVVAFANPDGVPLANSPWRQAGLF
jgi:hypothetical protein